jgi:hypothetical protein
VLYAFHGYNSSAKELCTQFENTQLINKLEQIKSVVCVSFGSFFAINELNRTKSFEEFKYFLESSLNFKPNVERVL